MNSLWHNLLHKKTDPVTDEDPYTLLRSDAARATVIQFDLFYKIKIVKFYGCSYDFFFTRIFNTDNIQIV